jgi:hypothetical protein
MSGQVGARAFYLDDAAEHLDASVLPPREHRAATAALDAERKRWCGVAQEQYDTTASHFTDEVEFGSRISSEGLQALDEDVLAPLRSGELSAKEAARRVAEMRGDLNKARAALRQAMEREEKAWADTSVEPEVYQRALARRAPQLFSGGRGLLTLPVYDD